MFVVDSNDRHRIDESRKGLETILADELRSVPVLIFANKQDLPDAMSSGTRRLCHVQPSSALRGEGLEEGLTWLTCVFQTGFSGPPLVMTVTVVQEGGTQQVSFTNLAGSRTCRFIMSRGGTADFWRGAAGNSRTCQRWSWAEFSSSLLVGKSCLAKALRPSLTCWTHRAPSVHQGVLWLELLNSLSLDRTTVNKHQREPSSINHGSQSGTTSQR